MPGLAAAWAVGEAVVVWRIVRREHRLPPPGALAGISLLFLAMGLVSEAVPRAAGTITALAWGLDVAAVLNVWPAGFGGQVTKAETASATAAGVATSPGQQAIAGGQLGIA